MNTATGRAGRKAPPAPRGHAPAVAAAPAAHRHAPAAALPQPPAAVGAFAPLGALRAAPAWARSAPSTGAGPERRPAAEAITRTTMTTRTAEETHP
ncbi:hypothetical protein ACIA98_10945 [Streptomyces sp. NPDC051366]|uniref:hypothetical protein n=1 Tax=Streptomyces sp. NPDC051366 TaxID=3365652 RepID=UPI0037BBDCC4